MVLSWWQMRLSTSLYPDSCTLPLVPIRSLHFADANCSATMALGYRAAPPMPQCQIPTLNTPAVIASMQSGCGLGCQFTGAASGVVNAYRASRAPIAPIQ